MRSQATAIMLSFLLGFAQIRAEVIPDGIMPKDKRQVVGTGVTTSSADPPTTSNTPTTSNSPTTVDPGTTTTQDPVTSDTPTSDPGTTDAGTTDAGTTTQPDPTTTAQTSQPSAGSSPVDDSTSIPTTVAVTTTNADGSTVTSQVSTNTLAPASSTRNGNSVISTDSSDSDIVRVGSSTINRSTLDHKTVITSALVAKQTSQRVFTSVWTSAGQVYSSVITEDAVYSSTTGFATATIKPSLANGGGNGSNLSDNAKQIIGGVVGGIGGAILVGGLAFVAWRLWGKKKAQREEHDEVWGGSRPDSIETAKRSSGMPAYDTYSNPNGAINTSSNF